MKNDIEIKKLFLGDRYSLDPLLQRSYEWEVNRVVNFINDILHIKFNRIGGGRCRYNIGDFITYKENELDDVKFICDGQQRITTLVLIFANIYHHNPSESIKGTIKNMLIKPIYDESGREKKVTLLKLKDNDDKILNKIIEKGTDGLTKEEEKSHLVKIYNEISDEFTNNMSKNELDGFYTSIYTNASYFERECESVEEAIKQFINLNGGQQSLSESRIVTSKLYGVYNGQPSDNEIELFLYTLSNMGEKKAKDFLCLYQYYKGYVHNVSYMKSSFEKICEEDNNILRNITDFYNNIYLKKFENYGNPFMKMQSSLRQIWIDLYTDKYSHMQDIDISEKDFIYKKFEWGCICNKILNKGSGENMLYFGWIKNFNKENGKLSDYVINKLKEKGIYENVNVINKWKSPKNRVIIYLLSVIEETYKKDIGIKEKVTHCSKPTLEHIHPQKKRMGEEYDCDDSIINCFGNKTIIGDEANKSLSNKAFTDKRDDYSKSPYFINSKHLCEYPNWTIDTVEDNEKFYFEMLSKHYELS